DARLRGGARHARGDGAARRRVAGKRSVRTEGRGGSGRRRADAAHRVHRPRPKLRPHFRSLMLFPERFREKDQRKGFRLIVYPTWAMKKSSWSGNTLRQKASSWYPGRSRPVAVGTAVRNARTPGTNGSLLPQSTRIAADRSVPVIEKRLL